MRGAHPERHPLLSVNSAPNGALLEDTGDSSEELLKCLPQDSIYVSHSSQVPQEFDFSVVISHDRKVDVAQGDRYLADQSSPPEGSNGRFEVAILKKAAGHVVETHKIRCKMRKVGKHVLGSVNGKGKDEENLDEMHNKEAVDGKDKDEDSLNVKSMVGSGNAEGQPKLDEQARQCDPEPNDCIILSSCAYVANGIDHILDGYSWVLITRVSGDNDNTHVNVVLRPVSLDQKDLNDEKTHLKKFGLFTGKLPWYRKLFCCGRMWQLLITGRAVDRQTAHQPIFYPLRNEAYFCSAFTYPAFKVDWDAERVGTLHAEEIQNKAHIWERFLNDSKNDYVCMHPLYEASTGTVLTYTFLHSKICRSTRVRLYEFGPDEQPYVEYHVKDRAALHMFGFTENYFVLFANSLQVKKRGICMLCCGKPILRTLNDNFCGELKIHFIPRRKAKGLHRFVVNTRQQGFVYHTINTFEDPKDGCIVVDAFVSKLNASRESSQFELGKEPVLDNEGDPFRFHIVVPRKAKAVVESKILCSTMDSTIDFHTVNPKYIGRLNEHWWMVSHERVRNSISGEIESVISHLYHIYVPWGKGRDGDVRRVEPAMDFNPNKTLLDMRSSPDWCESRVSYLRTPLFVPHKYARSECDGRLFCWSYDSIDEKTLGAFLLMFDGNLNSLVRVDLGQNRVPYSVHSSVYARNAAMEAQQQTSSYQQVENKKTPNKNANDKKRE